jgi:hypothetical protein
MRFLIQRGSDYRLKLVGPEIVFLINRSIKDAERFEVMSLFAPILDKYIWLAGRRVAFPEPYNN